MEITEIISIGFVMGAVGSLHCIGMCGPIAMALPMGSRKPESKLLGAVLYNLGRILTYSWLGLVLGMAGGFLLTTLMQQTVSIIFGGLILLYLVLPARIKKVIGKRAPAAGFLLYLRNQLGKLLATPTNSSLFGIGMLNGLLPCGMIYMALITSFMAGSIIKGGLLMAAFGAGTFPAMLAATFFGSLISQQARLHLRKAVPVFLFCMAALLVLRGLNLGIPYLSPLVPHDSSAPEVVCH